MPIYEYECTKCQERFEVFQKMSEDEEHVKCPKCGTGRPQRLLSAFCSGSQKSTGASSTGPSGHS